MQFVRVRCSWSVCHEAGETVGGAHAQHAQNSSYSCFVRFIIYKMLDIKTLIAYILETFVYFNQS